MQMGKLYACVTECGMSYYGMQTCTGISMLGIDTHRFCLQAGFPDSAANLSQGFAVGRWYLL